MRNKYNFCRRGKGYLLGAELRSWKLYYFSSNSSSLKRKEQKVKFIENRISKSVALRSLSHNSHSDFFSNSFSSLYNSSIYRPTEFNHNLKKIPFCRSTPYRNALNNLSVYPQGYTLTASLTDLGVFSRNCSFYYKVLNKFTKFDVYSSILLDKEDEESIEEDDVNPEEDLNSHTDTYEEDEERSPDFLERDMEDIMEDYKEGASWLIEQIKGSFTKLKKYKLYNKFLLSFIWGTLPYTNLISKCRKDLKSGVKRSPIVELDSVIRTLEKLGYTFIDTEECDKEFEEFISENPLEFKKDSPFKRHFFSSNDTEARKLKSIFGKDLLKYSNRQRFFEVNELSIYPNWFNKSSYNTNLYFFLHVDSNIAL